MSIILNLIDQGRNIAAKFAKNALLVTHISRRPSNPLCGSIFAGNSPQLAAFGLNYKRDIATKFPTTDGVSGQLGAQCCGEIRQSCTIWDIYFTAPLKSTLRINFCAEIHHNGEIRQKCTICDEYFATPLKSTSRINFRDGIRHNWRRLWATRSGILRRNSPQRTAFRGNQERNIAAKFAKKCTISDTCFAATLKSTSRVNFRGAIRRKSMRLGTTRGEIPWRNSP